MRRVVSKSSPKSKKKKHLKISEPFCETLFLKQSNRRKVAEEDHYPIRVKKFLDPHFARTSTKHNEAKQKRKLFTIHFIRRERGLSFATQKVGYFFSELRLETKVHFQVANTVKHFTIIKHQKGANWLLKQAEAPLTFEKINKNLHHTHTLSKPRTFHFHHRIITENRARLGLYKYPKEISRLNKHYSLRVLFLESCYPKVFLKGGQR